MLCMPSLLFRIICSMCLRPHKKCWFKLKAKEEDRRRGVAIELLELDKGEDEDDIAIELGVSKEKKMSWST